MRAAKLMDGPGVSAINHRLEGVLIVAKAGGQRNLVPSQIVVRRGLDIAEDANRRPVQHTGIGKTGKPEGE